MSEAVSHRKHAKPRASLRLRAGLLFAWVPLMLVGCPKWQNDSQVNHVLMQPSRMTTDTVGLELGVAQLDELQVEDVRHFWRLLDHQEIPLEIRKRLDENGLRVGVMSPRPPSVFADLIYPPEIEHENLSEFQRQLYIKGHFHADSRMVSHAQIANRTGKAYPVMTSETHPNLSWTIEDRNRQVTGAGKQVHGVFEITTFPQGDGSVRVVLEPQIHHGDQTQRYGSTEHGINFKTTQTIQTVENLKFEVVLRAGETLVIGPTEDLDQLGHLFFGSSETPTSSQGQTTSLDTMDLADLDTSLDQLAMEVDQMETAGILLTQESLESSSIEDPIANGEDDVANQNDDGSELSYQEALEAEVREMLRVKDGEEAILPKLAFDPTPEKPKPLHRLLLVRVVQTQLDDLFDESEESEPLTNAHRY